MGLVVLVVDVVKATGFPCEEGTAHAAMHYTVNAEIVEEPIKLWCLKYFSFRAITIYALRGLFQYPAEEYQTGDSMSNL
jgi:hypothetical protein